MTCRKYDDTVPVLADIWDSIPTNNSNLLATSSQPFQINVTAAWSPIVSKKIFFEDYNTVNSFKATSDECVSGCTENIQNVDLSRTTDGDRDYSLRVAKVCDEAKNCIWTDIATSDLKTFNYNIYANSTAMGTKTATNQLSSTSNIADGTVKNLTITLKDIYWNQIIPASWISRTIDFNWAVNNSMYLDQHNKSWQKSVFTNTTIDPSNYLNRLDSSYSFNEETSTNGVYNYWFKVYTPTANQDNWPISDIWAAFNINSITFDVNGTLWAVSGQLIWSSAITSKFNPLYYTAISWDLDDGMIAGITQQSKINTYKNSWTTTSSPVLKVEFWGTDSNKYNFLHTIGNSCGTASNIVTSLTNAISNIWFPSINNDLCTRVNQKPNEIVTNPMKTRFSTHISYTLDGLDILYNSDLVGGDSYHWTEDALTYQVWVKISWVTSSQKTMSLTTNQDGTDILRIGDNTKTTQWVLALNQKTLSKEKILKNAYDFMRNVFAWTQTAHKIDNLSWNNTDGREVDYSASKSVIYYRDLAGANIDLYDSTSTPSKIGVSGKRTILIYGWNLYIKSNIFYNTTSDILGIIVLKDQNWNGWNIYIDPSVTNLAWTLFAEKSVLSYDWTKVLDWDTVVSKLRNQLHIYGNILSENTLWWSTMATPKCPYYVPVGSCDQVTAQKYDLNFLRRYFLTLQWIPYGWWKVSWGWTCTDLVTKVCTGHDPDLSKVRKILSSNTTIEPYAKYPVIIEYNSRIQSAPPLLFQN